MKKILVLVLALTVMLLSACAGQPEAENKHYEMDERADTAFFEYEVVAASAHSVYNGVHARPEYRLVVVDLTIENTEEYTLPMSRYDFRLQWGAGAEEYVYPLACYCTSQLPDEYDIPQGEELRGELIFQVPEKIQDMALGYLEIFEDEHQGDAHFIYFTV